MRNKKKKEIFPGVEVTEIKLNPNPMLPVGAKFSDHYGNDFIVDSNGNVRIDSGPYQGSWVTNSLGTEEDIKTKIRFGWTKKDIMSCMPVGIDKEKEWRRLKDEVVMENKLKRSKIGKLLYEED